MMRKLTFYTGPVYVNQIADKLTEAGFRKVMAGTERVYVEVEAHDNYEAEQKVLKTLASKFGTTYGLRIK